LRRAINPYIGKIRPHRYERFLIRAEIENARENPLANECLASSSRFSARLTPLFRKGKSRYKFGCKLKFIRYIITEREQLQATFWQANASRIFVPRELLEDISQIVFVGRGMMDRL
jgi:hypothetical protein